MLKARKIPDLEHCEYHKLSTVENKSLHIYLRDMTVAIHSNKSISWLDVSNSRIGQQSRNFLKTNALNQYACVSITRVKRSPIHSSIRLFPLSSSFFSIHNVQNNKVDFLNHRNMMQDG